ncbi:hypothetical protein SAV14893_024450 [Streptomyces avermitilis]|uniref:Uncharacterized protein n=1 Tax=Streptomyces avermitilis TaxID=33903 RepID=A0A4D4LP61_STRAX|nr:hypothetical protein SAV14893_024450 [Streptomyces avermitilis]
MIYGVPEVHETDTNGGAAKQVTLNRVERHLADRPPGQPEKGCGHTPVSRGARPAPSLNGRITGGAAGRAPQRVRDSGTTAAPGRTWAVVLVRVACDHTPGEVRLDVRLRVRAVGDVTGPRTVTVSTPAATPHTSARKERMEILSCTLVPSP